MLWQSDWDHRSVFTVLEESGSSLFHCYHRFGRIWKLTVSLFYTVLEESGSSLFHCFHCFGRIWKLNVFANFHCFGRIWKLTVSADSHCFVRESVRNQLQSSELPDSSKSRKQCINREENSSAVVSITWSYHSNLQTPGSLNLKPFSPNQSHHPLNLNPRA
jgi:hypothetical protein